MLVSCPLRTSEAIAFSSKERDRFLSPDRPLQRAHNPRRVGIAHLNISSTTKISLYSKIRNTNHMILFSQKFLVSNNKLR